MIWKPDVTVAAIIEADGRFLLVEERTREGVKLNQPAGHLEPHESLIEGAVREALEETAYDFVPEHLIGIYRWSKTDGKVTYLRFAFAGKLGERHAKRRLDTGIVRAVWLTIDEIHASQQRHRSPLVLRCVDDYLRGRRFPLDLLVHCD
ncbi:MAG TPA: NUDIX hydrolase [Burkholderiales bacterium]|jgi:8-oxo-dGTP pyrophosphatase MutT (NUDIX family)|nr:NUDIX hydrolase [Burkholderiales bacterium]